MPSTNQTYIQNLKITDVPWRRLITPYGRATAFPEYLAVLERADDIKAAENALNELTGNIEHQSTLWHASPFGMVFLTRIFTQTLAASETNPVARYIAAELFDFFTLMANVCEEIEELEHPKPLPFFGDMLSEEYLWSEDYDEEEDEMRYEEEEIFADDLFYSFYYYSRQALLSIKPQLDKLLFATWKTTGGQVIKNIRGAQIIKITHNKKQYLPLLLLADEEEAMIDRYLERGTMYVLEDGDVKAECLVTDEGDGILEIKSLATLPQFQRRGYAKALINFIEAKYKERFKILQVGTGDSPATIPFYQKLGFVRSHIIKNFFTDNYSRPIYDGGVLLKDMVYLRKQL